MARIFQDAAGTIPVTTFDQPVGKIVRGAGTVDLVQSVSGSRPTMARWPRGGRRNLLTWTEDLSQWILNEVGSGTLSYTANQDGSSTIEMDIAGSTSGNDWTRVYKSIPVEPNSGPYVSSWELKLDEGGPRLLLRDDASSPGNNVVVTLTEIFNQYTYVSETGSTSYRSANALWIRGGTSARDKIVFSMKNPQFEFGDTPSPYQRVTTDNDVTEEGVESLWHLYNDGGDSLQTDGPVPAGTYGYAWIDPYGAITFDTRTSDGINPVVVADDPGRYLDIILREGDFSASEKVAIIDYWGRRYK